MKSNCLIICLMLMCTLLSGCIGNSEVETSEGDDVVLGESLDDWPTYYVPAATDLPTCDSTTLGRLYYVEADTNFQACMSTGWEVVEIGGSTSNLVMNVPPTIHAEVWYSDDDLIHIAPDNSVSRVLYLEWTANDTDGTIASLGLDYDADGVIDIPFSQNSGIFSDQPSITLQNGEIASGAFYFPIDSGMHVHRMTSNFGYDCSLYVQTMIDVIVVDDDGAKTIQKLTFDLMEGYGRSYTPIGPWDVNDYELFPLPQADIDWVQGVGVSTCTTMPQFSLSDHPDTLTSADDNLAILTVDDPGDWSTWLSTGQLPFMDSYCIDNMGVKQHLEDENYLFSGSDETNPQAGDYWTIVEYGQFGSCDPSTAAELEVSIFFNDGDGNYGELELQTAIS